MATRKITLDDLLAWLNEQRKHGHVVFDDSQQCWHVFGHDEANQVLSDPVTYSSYIPAAIPDQEDFALFARGNLAEMDDPQHRKLRTLVSQAFTPKVIAGLEPRIVELTNEILDHAGERFDLIDKLAYPLPIIVIAELLGVPSIDQTLFWNWAEIMLSQEPEPEQMTISMGDEAVSTIAPAVREMNSYFLEFIRIKRANPGSDLISQLIRSETRGQGLSDEEIVGFIGLLLMAGHTTTTATLGNAIVNFAENPTVVAEIRADLALLPTAIEESLRLRTPFPRMNRITTADCVISGTHIPAGQLVVPWLVAANRDERVFPNPDRFDLHRAPNPHLSFGRGIHFCLGAPLARLEVRIALNLLLSRYRDIEIPKDKSVEYRNPWMMVAVSKLPLELQAA